MIFGGRQFAIISAIAGQKPTKKDIISVIIAFVGIMALIFVPI